MPRRIEVPSADALFGRPTPAPDPAPAPGAEAAVPRSPRPRRARGTRAAASADQQVLRRLGRVESALAEMPVDRLIELREALEALLAGDDRVETAELERLIALAGG